MRARGREPRGGRWPSRSPPRSRRMAPSRGFPCAAGWSSHSSRSLLGHRSTPLEEAVLSSPYLMLSPGREGSADRIRGSTVPPPRHGSHRPVPAARFRCADSRRRNAPDARRLRARGQDPVCLDDISKEGRIVQSQLNSPSALWRLLRWRERAHLASSSVLDRTAWIAKVTDDQSNSCRSPTKGGRERCEEPWQDQAVTSIESSTSPRQKASKQAKFSTATSVRAPISTQRRR